MIVMDVFFDEDDDLVTFVRMLTPESMELMEKA